MAIEQLDGGVHGRRLVTGLEVQTTADMLFHEVGRGFFTIHAGTVGPIRDESQAIRERLAVLAKRGERWVCVELLGGARYVLASEVRSLPERPSYQNLRELR